MPFCSNRSNQKWTYGLMFNILLFVFALYALFYGLLFLVALDMTLLSITKYVVNYLLSYLILLIFVSMR